MGTIDIDYPDPTDEYTCLFCGQHVARGMSHSCLSGGRNTNTTDNTLGRIEANQIKMIELLEKILSRMG